MAKSTLEPEGGKITTIKTESNCGSYWPVKLRHNGIEQLIPENGLRIHINGGAVYINGIDVTRKVTKGIENVFRHDTWNGGMNNTTKE